MSDNTSRPSVLGVMKGENSGDGSVKNPYVIPILESTWRGSHYLVGDRITAGSGRELLCVIAVHEDKKTILCTCPFHGLIKSGAKYILYAQFHLTEYKPKITKNTDPDYSQIPTADLFAIVSANIKAGTVHDKIPKNSPVLVPEEKPKTPNIDAFCKNLTERAHKGLIDPVIGRKKEIQRITQILGRRRKNNPVILGEAGTGKSALVEGLALSIVNKDPRCRKLHGVSIVSLDLTLLVAGTTLRGQFEERIAGLIKELELFSDLVVFIDEIHTIVSCGQSEGANDAANILKPALARGDIQVIGATTLKEYDIIKRDAALARRFQPVVLEDLSREEIRRILRGVKGLYEKHHDVKYTNKAIERILDLSDGIVGRHAPDIQLDLLDEAGSASTRKKVDAEDVERVYELQYASNQNKNRVVGFGADV